jgi:uncharacterized protein (DUF697 family)
MNKKKLPRAIRPTAAHALGDKPGATVHEKEPWELKPAASGAEDAHSADVTDDSPQGRRAAAVKLVKRFSLWAGVAGLVPVPLADLAAVSGVQIQMLRRLSQIYDVPFSENRSKAIIAGLAGAMVPASSSLGAASLLKGIPLLGMTVGALTMPALSVGATYAIGMAFIQHFISGGTLLDFDPPDYHEFIKVQKELHGART